MGKAYTTRTEQFAGEIVREKLSSNNRLKINSTAFYQHQLNKMKPGDQVSIYITNKKPKRTEQQNRYYWGVYLPLLAQETGEPDVDRLHTLFKGKFLTTSIDDVLGEKVRMTKSTTDLSVGEFNDYIVSIHALTNVEPPPTQNYNLAPLHSELPPKKRERNGDDREIK